jgi:hypothetical protein
MCFSNINKDGHIILWKKNIMWISFIMIKTSECTLSTSCSWLSLYKTVETTLYMEKWSYTIALEILFQINFFLQGVIDDNDEYFI